MKELFYTNKIIGIYKLTAPNGKIYIGQSQDIYLRWKAYKKSKDKLVIKQMKLYNSLIEFGSENHKFEIIYECPISMLDNHEIFFIAMNKSYEEGLNSTRGGSSGRGYIWSEEARQKAGESSKLAWARRRELGTDFLSEEHKLNILQAITGKKRSEESKLNMRKPRSEEAKENMRKNRKPISEESKLNMRKPRSEEAKENMRKNRKPISDDTRENIRLSSIKAWENKKLSEGYNSDKEKLERSERQKRAWVTIKNNKGIK